MSAPQPAPPEAYQPSGGQALFALVLIALGAVAFYFYNDSRRNLPDSVAQIQQENEALRRQLTEFRDRMAELDAEDLMDLEGRQILQARLLELSAAGTLATRQADLFAAEATAWQRLTAGIETSEEGRRIAANSEATAQFAALVREERPRPELAAELKDRLETLLLPVEEALKAKNSVYTPAEDLEARIKAVGEEVAQGAAVYRNHNARLKNILQSAAPAASAGTPSLGQALADLERQWIEAENRRVAEAIARVREDESKKLAAQKAEAERQLAEAKREAQKQADERELRRIRDEQEDAARQEQERIAARERQLKQETFLSEFNRDLPQIRRYLAAFLAEGYAQPIQRGNMRVTAEKGPMSLSALRSAGALQEDASGLTRLMYIVDQQNNDRPRGGFPPYAGNVPGGLISQKDVPFVKTAQGYLIKYGDLLVEKGMLRR